jgi:hypothetical protein
MAWFLEYMYLQKHVKMKNLILIALLTVGVVSTSVYAQDGPKADKKEMKADKKEAKMVKKDVKGSDRKAIKKKEKAVKKEDKKDIKKMENK